MINKNDIITICRQNVDEFNKKINKLKYEIKGIFNSEMLLFSALATYFNTNTIIESGRARGYSTLVLAQYFEHRPIQIISVECDTGSEDVVIANKKLNKYPNVYLLFGDSFKVLPKYLKTPCCVLIDGPKGDGALLLALKLLRYKTVKLVAIHDVHYLSPHRKIMQKLFRHTFFSDDIDFVRNFKYLDKSCWKEQGKYIEFKDWGPYLRRGNKNRSYSSTLGVIFNADDATTFIGRNSYLIKLCFHKIKQKMIWLK